MFRCTQVHSLYLGLPHGLDNVAKSLRLKEQKLEEGKSLIRFFMKKENLDLLTSNCTMKGQAHDELHKWLLPYLDLVTDFSKDKSAEQFAEIQNAFTTFNQYFE